MSSTPLVTYQARRTPVLVRTMTSQAAAPVSPVVAVGLQVPTGGQSAASPGVAFGITPQPKGLSSNVEYY